MKFFGKSVKGGIAAILALSTAFVVTMVGNASAACYQYDPNGQVNTSQTPVFNNFCNAPFGIGNEADFVRIRQSANGDVKDNANNPTYGNTVNSACADGTKFDVWNYVHNDASQAFNNNGSGSAVAHNVKLALNAPINTTDSTFNFGSKITASNAATVQDTAALNCNGKKVNLKLVSGSVHLISKPYGWKDLNDGAVNGTTTLGSPDFGSGNVWGCWDYRIVVVYQVTVEKEKTPPPQVKATCDMFSIFADKDRKVKVTQFKYTAENANFKNVVVNWGDNSNNLTLTDGTKLVGQTHQYSADGTYNITAVVTFSVAGKPDVTSGGAGTACAQQVTFTSNQPPKVTPPPTTPTPPSTLVNTGPGEVAALFAATTIAGSFAYRRMLRRRLSDV